MTWTRARLRRVDFARRTSPRPLAAAASFASPRATGRPRWSPRRARALADPRRGRRWLRSALRCRDTSPDAVRVPSREFFERCARRTRRWTTPRDARRGVSRARVATATPRRSSSPRAPSTPPARARIESRRTTSRENRRRLRRRRRGRERFGRREVGRRGRLRGRLRGGPADDLVRRFCFGGGGCGGASVCVVFVPHPDRFACSSASAGAQGQRARWRRRFTSCRGSPRARLGLAALVAEGEGDPAVGVVRGFHGEPLRDAAFDPRRSCISRGSSRGRSPPRNFHRNGAATTPKNMTGNTDDNGEVDDAKNMRSPTTTAKLTTRRTRLGTPVRRRPEVDDAKNDANDVHGSFGVARRFGISSNRR